VCALLVTAIAAICRKTSQRFNGASSQRREDGKAARISGPLLERVGKSNQSRQLSPVGAATQMR
jgi:hypothetical protein